LVVGNFIRDRESNYLEGSLCILVYIIIAVTAFYFPNESHANETGEVGGDGGASSTTEAGVAAATAAAEHVVRALLA
jgi:Ca2+:H+ antiporter